MSQAKRSESTISAKRPSAGPALVRGLLFSSLLLAWAVITPQTHAQVPNIFVADDPSGSISSGGANIAYLQNSSGTDVTLTLDGNTVTTKANRLTIFDRSSGSWVLRAVLDEQSQPVSPPAATPTPTPTPSPGNNLLTGLYSYYRLDEASGPIVGAIGGRNLPRVGNSIGAGTGVINGCRVFPGNSSFQDSNSADFRPGSNPFAVTAWFKSAITNYPTDKVIASKYDFGMTPRADEWIIWRSVTTGHIYLSCSIDGTRATEKDLDSGVALRDTNWHFVAATWDGSTMKISVDNSTFTTASFTGPVYSGSATFEVGAEINNGTLSSEWNGSLDEIGIWIGRSLSQSDVSQIYNNGAALPFSSFQ